MKKKEMKTIGFFVVAIMIAMVGVFPIAMAGQVTQEEIQVVNVTVDAAVPGLNVMPPSYDYGSVVQGQCSVENPNGTIQLNSTGNVDIEVTTIAVGIFEGIDYCIGSTPCTPWTDVNSFSVVVPFGTVEEVNTRICVPVDYLGNYTGTVTFEYIAV